MAGHRRGTLETWPKTKTSSARSINSSLKSVKLHHAQTISTTRRDFRWVRLASNETEPCKLPEIPTGKPILFGANCLQPILWHSKTLKPEAAAAPGTASVYSSAPPEPKAGHWTGYFIEVTFHSESKGEFKFTTPGYAWPNTLPFADCHGASCLPRLV